MNICELHDYLYRTDGSSVKVIKKEIYRYLGYRNINPDETIDAITDELLKEAVPVLKPACLCEAFAVKQLPEKTDLGFTVVSSENLKTNLRDSHHIILIAATIGPMFDRLMIKYSKTSPLKEAILQAMGAMFIESFLDDCNEVLASTAQAQGYCLRPRYSPGYGDLPLSLQRDIFNTIRADRIGLTLCDSLLMMPSKSVTAIIGIEGNP